MTVYFIYEKKKNLSPILYSFTTSKELIDKFKTERQMELFSISENKMKKKDFKIFEKDHSSIELTLGRFKTVVDAGEDFLIKHVEIVCTYGEEMEPYVMQDKIIREISKSCMIEASFMKKDIIEALDTLCYFIFSKYQTDIDYNINPFLDGINYDISKYDFEIDGFGVFMKYHGYTMRKE